MNSYKCIKHKSNEGFTDEEGKWVCWYCYTPFYEYLVVPNSDLWREILNNNNSFRRFKGLKRDNPITIRTNNIRIHAYLLETPRSSRKFAIEIFIRNRIVKMYYFDSAKELAVNFFNNLSEGNLIEF